VAGHLDILRAETPASRKDRPSAEVPDCRGCSSPYTAFPSGIPRTRR
jgi:hypothetical protein